MNIKVMTMAAIMSLVFAAPAAFAAGSDEKGDEAMGSGSGAALDAASFEELDTDGDGLISEDELNVYGSTAAGNPDEAEEESKTMLKEHDMDGDGKISFEEFEEGKGW